MHGPWQDGESQVLVVIPPGALAGINTPVRVLQVRHTASLSDPTLITQFCIRCIF